jgi:hypothetical protein
MAVRRCQAVTITSAEVQVAAIFGRRRAPSTSRAAAWEIRYRRVLGSAQARSPTDARIHARPVGAGPAKSASGPAKTCLSGLYRDFLRGGEEGLTARLASARR